MGFLEQKGIFFKRLAESNGCYSVTSKVSYKPTINLNKYTEEIVNWSYEVVWGRGYMKPEDRDKSSVFKNSLMGKFGEFGLYEFFYSLGYNPSYPDMSVREKGDWDDGDLLLDGRNLQIKSTYSKGNLLLLKKEDYDENGNYIHGKNGNPVTYNAFFLCRVSPDLKDVLPINGNENPGLNFLYECLENVNFRIDIPGYITLSDFKKIISDRMYIPKNGSIGSREISKDLYYCQSGDLRSVKDIPRKK